MPNLAAFNVNGVLHSTSAHSVSYSATVNLALVTTVGVNTVTWRVFGTSQSGMASPTITPAGSPSGATASFPFMATPGDDVGRAVGIECKVIDNGGNQHVAYAVIGVLSAAGVVPFVSGEVDYRSTTHGTGSDMNLAIANAATASTAGPESVKSAVRLATIAVLPAHSFGSNTMTASANGALSVDGVAVASGDRILVKDEAASHLQHGIYTVTATGSAGAPWVLTRATDWDAANEFEFGSQVLVMAGTQINQIWAMSTAGTIVLNTTAIAFTRVSAGDIEGQSDITLTVDQKLRDARVENVHNTGSNMAAFDAALSAAQTAGVPLEISQPFTISATRVVDHPLRFVGTGRLIVAAGCVLQLGALPEASEHKEIFDVRAETSELFTSPGDFSNAAWTKTNLGTISPGAALSADRIATGTATAEHKIGQAAANVAGLFRVVFELGWETLRRIYVETNGTQRSFIAPGARVTGAPTLTFAEIGSTGDTITRSAGSFISDGFKVGQRVSSFGTASNNFRDALITGVSASVLTLDTQDLAAEAIATSFLFVSSTTKTISRNNAHALHYETLSDGLVRVTLDYSADAAATTFSIGFSNEASDTSWTAANETVLLREHTNSTVLGRMGVQRAEVRLRAGAGGRFRGMPLANWYSGSLLDAGYAEPTTNETPDPSTGIVPRFDPNQGFCIAARWNSMVRGIVHVLTNFSANTSPNVLGIAEGAYTTRTTIDCTLFQSLQVFDWTGAHLYPQVGRDKAAVDLTGASGCKFTAGCPDIRAFSACLVGVLESRPEKDMSKFYGGSIATGDAGSSCGKHETVNASIKGGFMLACWYNIAGEESKHVTPDFDNVFALSQSAAASTTLSGGIDAVTTTIPLTSATNFPDPSVDGLGEYYIVVGTAAAHEIMRVVSKSGSNLTVVRNQFSGTDHNAPSNAPIALSFSGGAAVAARGQCMLFLGQFPLEVDRAKIQRCTPHSMPGNDAINASSTGYNLVNARFTGVTLLGSVVVHGFSRVAAADAYLTNTFGPHVNYDGSFNSAGSINATGGTWTGIYSHGTGQGTPNTSIKFTGQSQATDYNDITFRGPRGTNSLQLAYELGYATYTRCTFECNEESGIAFHGQSRISGCDFWMGSGSGAGASPPLILPAVDTGSALTTGSCIASRIQCRNRDQISLAANMQGTRLVIGGFVDRGANSGAGAYEAGEILEFGRDNIAEHTVEGIRVIGRRGPNLPNSDDYRILAPMGDHRFLTRGPSGTGATANTLSANRVAHVKDTGATTGQLLYVTRLDNSAFTYRLNLDDETTELHTFPAGAQYTLELSHNGTDWTVARRLPVSRDPVLVVDPPLFGSALIYLDADVINSSNGAEVDTVYSLDGSVNAIEPASPGAAEGPLFRPRGVDGRPALEFTVAGPRSLEMNGIVTSIDDNNTACTIAVQWQVVNTSGTNTLWSASATGDAAPRFRAYYTSGGLSIERRGTSGGTTTVGPVAFDTTIPHVMIFVFSGTTIDLYIDGSSTAALTGGMNTATLGTLDRFMISGVKLGTDATITQPGDFKVRRFRVSTGAMNPTDRDTLFAAWDQ